MMIWFAGILQNACVITPMKIKQQQTKHWVVSVVFQRNYAHLLTLSVESTCSTVKTQSTNFSISGTSKIIYFCGFLALPPLFFRRLMETSHLGAPIRDLQSHMAFFYVILFFSLEIETSGPLKELSQCKVCFDNLLLETSSFRPVQFQKLSLHTRSRNPRYVPEMKKVFVQNILRRF